ncbi:MAG: phosphatase PAP2 family protein [Alphaproteobacteria bacterium]|nr:phosphatase PAP2 family protein [Alphaproteobacteria bacterium]
MSQQHFYLNRRWTHALAIARRWIPAFAGMTIFFAVEFILFRYIDRPLAAYTHSLDQTSPALIHFFRAITDLGKSIWYLVPCGLATLFCAFLSRGKDVRPVYRRLFSYIGARALFLFATIALSGIVCDILKPIMGRARPHLWLQNGIYGFDPFNRLGFLWNSMPSGHTTTACALAFSLSLLYPRGRFLWFAFALALAASRVMVDAHYLSDVCAGGLLGWLTVRLFFKHGMVRLGKVIFPIDTTPATE